MHNLTVNVTEALDSRERVAQPVAPLAATIGPPSAIDDVYNMQGVVEDYARQGWVAWEPEPLE